MAIARADLIADTTSTSGTGTYTLNDPASPGGGFRTLADAVADGHVTDGDTVYYVVVDNTKEGGALEFERGSGTVGSSGTTLTRTVTQSSNSDNEVNWGGGGSRTVYVVLDAAAFALLAATNTFTGAQTFSALLTATGGLTATGTTSSPLVAIDGGASTGRLTVRSDRTSSTVADLALAGKNSTGGTINYGLVRATITASTAGSEASRAEVWLYNSGSQARTHTFNNDGSITDTQNSRDFAFQGVLSAPSGTRLLLGNNSVPSGWSIVASLADRTIMLTSTIGEVDDTGGSWTSGLTASTTVNGHALTESELPSHTHPSPAGNGYVVSLFAGGDFVASGAGTAWKVFTDTGATGSNSSHSHTASTSINSTSYRPAYYKSAFIEKS